MSSMPSLTKAVPPATIPAAVTIPDEKPKPKMINEIDINSILNKKRRNSSFFPLPSNINITKMKKGVKQSYMPLTNEALELMEQIQEASLKIDLSLQKERSNLLKRLSELKQEKQDLNELYSHEEEIYMGKAQALKEQIKQENAHLASLSNIEEHLAQNIITKTQLVVNSISQEALYTKLSKQKKELQEELDSIAIRRKGINDELMNHFKIMMTNKVKLQSELSSLEDIRNEMIARKFAIEQSNKNQPNQEDNSMDTLNLDEENSDMRIKINNFAIDLTTDNIKNISKSHMPMNDPYNANNNNNLSKVDSQGLKQFNLF